MNLIEADYTEENFSKFGEAYEWEVMIKESGCGSLISSEGEPSMEELETWLCRALVSQGLNEDDALKKVRSMGGQPRDPRPSRR